MLKYSFLQNHIKLKYMLTVVRVLMLITTPDSHLISLHTSVSLRYLTEKHLLVHFLSARDQTHSLACGRSLQH